MPPKGKGTSLKEEERTEVQCRVCNAGLPGERRVWILAKNGVRHLASDEHKNAVDQVENAQRIQENLDSQRHTARNVRIRVTQIPAPIVERPSVGAPHSAAELDMWAEYEQTGGLFTAGDEEDVEAMHRRLAQQVDVFGLLDPKETAERLGFDGDEAISKDLLQIEAEDDFLAEIMANAGLEEQDPADVHADASGIQREGNMYFPYPNKTPGELRTKEHTLAELKKQVELACGGRVKTRPRAPNANRRQKDVYTQYWIEQILARAAEMRQQEPDVSEATIKSELIQWTRDNEEKLYSPFLTLKGFDPAADTPVELLHTILLGAVKYVWHMSHTPWSAEKKKTYSIRLQATSTEGLSIHAIHANYIMQYAGSLIGRQFKTIIQTAVFHLHDLVTEDQFTAWKANDLKIAVANVLDAVAQIDPSKIMTKIKYHLLTHIDFDAIQLGPLIAMATEIFESFNAVFRYCSIYSNHLAPSRDIAIQFGRQETVKHQLTGGRWMSKSTGDWHGAGSGVRHFIEKHPILQRLVGWTPEKQLKHGDTKLAPLKTHLDICKLAFGHGKSNSPSNLNFGVVLLTARQSSIICGRLSDILCNQSGKAIVVVELFQIIGGRHSRYGMPILKRCDDEITFSILPAKVPCRLVIGAHADTGCEATGVRPVMQERVESDKIEHFIVHAPLDRFVINTHGFHNSHLVRATVSRDLWAPVALFEDRRAKHDEFSARLRETRATKATKRKEAAARKRPRQTAVSSDDDEAEQRPRKRGRIPQAAPRSRAPKSRTTAAARAVVSGSTMIGLAAGRSKRKIKRSARAIEAEESESSDSEGNGDGDSDEEEFNSGDDFLN
ncbi:hypothetical protein B0H14DRAFT_2623326 [Mycena olivaceomarginata]|nr:hypothetical protein B0H14DRAFT_2623326 [Mycena olivaceomarginata]